MALKDELQTAMKDAMRAKDKARLGVLRMILADIKRVEVDERVELDDARVLAVLDKMQKQRRDSISQYEAAGRQDLADTEKTELEVVAQFLPAALTEQELDALIDDALEQTGATGMADMGQLMGVLKPKVQGRADMSDVSRKVKARLG